MAMQPIPPLRLDVRPHVARHEPPLSAILAAADQLESGQSLVLIAPFEPLPLYSLLAEQGLSASAVARDDGSWEITFAPRRPARGRGRRAPHEA